MCYIFGFYALRGVAQLGLERCVRDAEVAGSNPVTPIVFYVAEKDDKS
jgi:hypothetical protein